MFSNVMHMAKNEYSTLKLNYNETDLDHISVEHGWDEGGGGPGEGG
jgi:hypothetical protein